MSKLYTTVYCQETFETELVPVTNLFDANGDETVSLEAAYSFVAQLPNGEWLVGSTFAYTVRQAN